LYGASALGGVVNVITARPKHEFEATARIQFGNYRAGNAQGMVNIPLGDTFAVRLTATRTARWLRERAVDLTFSGPMLPFLPFPTWLQSIADNYFATLTVVAPPVGVPARRWAT
jgi:hypothetical protein